MKDFKELIDFFDSGIYRTVFCWIDKKEYGENSFPYMPEEISINIHLFVVNIFTHEYMHYKYPNLSEREIEKRAKRAVRRMSSAEIIKLSEHILGNAIWEIYPKSSKRKRKQKRSR